MEQQDEEWYDLYITPEERQLLARVARGHGVGSDYLALRRARPSSSIRGRPIPRWLGHQVGAARPAKATPKQRSLPQERHCRCCAHLAPLAPLDSQTESRYQCGAGIWTGALRLQSVRNSARVRRLSRQCSRYQAVPQPARAVRHRCRVCRELIEADTIDERYVCGRSVWTNPMKPLSVAKAQRLARLSASCPYFAPRPSQARAAADEDERCLEPRMGAGKER